MKIIPAETKTSYLHGLMLGAIAPRPIAFASTVDGAGRPNLSPFSFFNAFGSKPPIVAFSPARRVRDNTIKHTLENIYETKEVVINVVTYAMVQQASLSSCEYPKGVNEFVKAGFTPLPSERIRPPRVKESPVQMECRVLDVVETGKEGGAANIIICEIVLMHVADGILDEEKRIDPDKIDLVARMGGAWYCRASGKALFRVPKPSRQPGIGFDSLPAVVRNSRVLSGNDLGRLANVEKLPVEADLAAYRVREEVKKLLDAIRSDTDSRETALHLAAKTLIEADRVDEAWNLLLSLE